MYPLLKAIPTYIANSAELVSKLDQVKPPDYFQFIAADVDNLYPSINIDEGLDALKYFLKHSTGFCLQQIRFILLLTRWVLANNYVSFGDAMYLQISGTAMGTPCAVIFACIFVHIIEQEALSALRFSYISQRISLFVRFIDDLSIIVSSYDVGQLLINALNARRKSIHFTATITNSETQFLDLTLFKTTGKPHGQLAVRAFTKPMNKFLFLPPNSCHPSHVFSGWVVGYGKRLRLNCSQDTDFNACLNDFKSRLVARGYPIAAIVKAFEVIPPRATILNNIKQSIIGKQRKEIGTPFAVTYSPEINAILPTIKRALSLSDEAYLDPHCIQIFGHRTTPLLSFKRGRNLRDFVSPSALTIVPDSPTL